MTSIQSNTITANSLEEKMPEQEHQFQLIKGKFSPAEAGNLLLELISNKIKFHNLEAFIIFEQRNGDVSPAQKRVAALKAAREPLQNFLQQAKAMNCQVEINSVVEIKMVPR